MPHTSTQATQAGRRLLAAASELFYRRGITAVGVAGIADAAGVTKKTLYDCYGSKAELVTAYLRNRNRVWWDSMRQHVERSAAPRVLAVFDAYRDHPSLELDRGCGFQRGAAELAPEHPGWAVIVEHKAAVRAEIARLLGEDVPEGVLSAKDLEDLVELIYLILEGASFQRGLDGDPSVLDRAADRARGLVQATLEHGRRTSS